MDRMNNIKISWGPSGKKWSAHFRAVRGSAGTWDLVADRGYLLGRLQRIDGKWIFECTPGNEELTHMAAHFGNHLTVSAKKKTQ